MNTEGPGSDRPAGEPEVTGEAPDPASATSPAVGPNPTAPVYAGGTYPPAPTSQPGPGYPPPGYAGFGYPTQPAYAPGRGYPPPAGYPPQPGYGPYGAQPPPYGGPFGPPVYGGPGFGYGAPLWAAPAVPPGPAAGLVWAGMGIRFAALIIDSVVEVVAFFVGALIAYAAGYQEHGPNPGYSPAGVAILWITFAVLVAYTPSCWWAFRGTIGQRLIGLQVLRAADGESLSAGATTIRYLIWLVCTCTVVIGIVAAIVASEKPDKRTWLDDGAGSVVVRRA